QRSDRQYDWTLEELATFKMSWYGGADLSKLHDLTAAAIYGNYRLKAVFGEYVSRKEMDVDIVITHAWFPIVAAARKAEEDGIPLFGWQEDGWLTMCNNPTVNHSDVVNWFIEMKKKGFNIR